MMTSMAKQESTYSSYVKESFIPSQLNRNDSFELFMEDEKTANSIFRSYKTLQQPRSDDLHFDIILALLFVLDIIPFFQWMLFGDDALLRYTCLKAPTMNEPSISCTSCTKEMKVFDNIGFVLDHTLLMLSPIYIYIYQKCFSQEPCFSGKNWTIVALQSVLYIIRYVHIISNTIYQEVEPSTLINSSILVILQQTLRELLNLWYLSILKKRHDIMKTESFMKIEKKAF